MPECVSQWQDPHFEEKQKDVLSLYLNPPGDDEVVICFDEKTYPGIIA